MNTAKTRTAIAPNLTNKCLRAALLAALSGSLSASAAIVVDWGGDYVTAAQTYRRTATSMTTDYAGGTGRTAVLAFNTATPLSPLNNYTAPSGKTALFYGGYINSWSGTVGTGSPSSSVNLPQVNNNTTADRIQIRAQAPTLGTGGSMTSRFAAQAVVFLQSDYLGEGNTTTPLSFGPTSSLSLNIPVAPQFTDIRFMIQLAGGQWYLSQTSYNTLGVKTLSGTSLLNEQWATFNPISSGTNTQNASSLVFDPNSASFGAISLTTAITAVGYYGRFTSTTDAASKDLLIQNFSADLTAIPEPSAFGALAGLGALGFAASRRRRRA